MQTKLIEHLAWNHPHQSINAVFHLSMENSSYKSCFSHHVSFATNLLSFTSSKPIINVPVNWLSGDCRVPITTSAHAKTSFFGLCLKSKCVLLLLKKGSLTIRHVKSSLLHLIYNFLVCKSVSFIPHIYFIS